MANGYDLVRHAIIKQAIDDYKRALIYDNRGKIHCLEKWFLSDWGEFLSGDNGAYIIEKTRKEVFKNA